MAADEVELDSLLSGKVTLNAGFKLLTLPTCVSNRGLLLAPRTVW